ncbi:AzlC family ABC transporter permease [Clostridium paraputrificum]|uniref:AzlC family ABC transporter permease n=1 Tax=Clostridium TaxID=1485 RepID=UPI003D334263
MLERIKNEKSQKNFSGEDIAIGAKMAIPICIGYIPLGIACGILSQKAGLSPLEIGALSLFVFAGSGQFITASMLIAHASMFSIIFTTFIINLRHMLMSSALSPFFSNSSKRFLMFFSHEITDETFAINLVKFKEDSWNPNKALILNVVSHLTWIISNIVGGVTGSLFNFNDMIINFILTSMFIALLCLQIKGFIYILSAVISAIIAVSLSLVMDSTFYIIIATLLAATICYFLEKFLKERTEDKDGD